MSNYNYYPRTLIISRNALRQDGSNGKVMEQFFADWKQECIAQFYTYNEEPNSSICQRFYRVTDKDALRSFLSMKKKFGGVIDNCVQENTPTAIIQEARVKKTPLSLLLRDLMWNTNRWRSRIFWRWIEDFKPEVIFMMAGATSFTHKIAIDVSCKYNIPLIVFNTENYYFKKYDYLIDVGWKWLYPLLRWEGNVVFRHLMRQSAHEIYNNEYLNNIYSKEFGKQGSVIYQATSLKQFPDKEKNGKLVFSYAGNLGLDRHKALIELSNALQEISPDYKLNVYGKVRSKSVEKELLSSKGIIYHGLVPYSQVIEVIKESDYMIHAESFDPFWVKDLCSAFSTKISDILASGRCLILFAHKSLACTEYVIKNECGCVITQPSELVNKIKELIKSDDLKKKYIANGLVSAKRDMDSSLNSRRFREIMINTIKNNKECH